MEKEYKPDYERDFRTYRKAGFAAFLAQSEETQRFVPGSLEQLASDVKELSVSESRLLGDLLKRGQGLESVLSIYPSMYKEARDNLPLGKLLTNYDKVIADYLDKETAEAFKKILGKFKSENLKTLADKLDEASWKIKGQEKGYSSEKIEDLTIEKYKKEVAMYKAVTDIVNYLEMIQFEEWKPELVKKYNKQSLKEKVEALQKIT